MFHMALSEADMKMVKKMLNPMAACDANETAIPAELI